MGKKEKSSSSSSSSSSIDIDKEIKAALAAVKEKVSDEIVCEFKERNNQTLHFNVKVSK
jgi:hypothetical protein